MMIGGRAILGSVHPERSEELGGVPDYWYR